jgi:hypothetical protein
VIDADSGATRVLGAPAVDAVAPVFADAQIVAGVRDRSYLILDAVSGAVRTQAAMRVQGTPMGEYADLASTSDGTMLELLRRFESEAGPLWIWNVRDSGKDIAKVDERGINDPIFWPGRTEIAFTRSSGLAVVDYRSGRTRPLVSPPVRIVVVAVEPGGRFALVRGDTGLQIVERVDDELRARPDLPLIAGSTLKPLGLVMP